ncbi:MAG: hypothetical protein JSW68_14535, partial [Burkholderiales bacterium]
RAGTGSGTVSSSPAGISCGSDCGQSYAAGTVVSLTATADAGSTFSGWSGDPDCEDGQVTMNAARSCTATFSPIAGANYQLSFVVEALAPGTVETGDGGINCGQDCTESYPAGTSVTVYVALGLGASTVNWAGDCAGFGQQTGFILVMNSDKFCAASILP